MFSSLLLPRQHSTMPHNFLTNGPSVEEVVAPKKNLKKIHTHTEHVQT